MDGLVEKVALAIGDAQGYVSKPVRRKRFDRAARAAIEAVLDEIDAPSRENAANLAFMIEQRQALSAENMDMMAGLLRQIATLRKEALG